MEHRGFLGTETSLYDTVTVDTRHHIFVKPMKCTPPVVNHSVYHRLWTRWQVSEDLSAVINVPLWCGVSMVEGGLVWGKRLYEKALYFLLYFATNLKML